MSNFDFTALLMFLQSLFNAFVSLFNKFGFTFGEDEGEAEPEAEG